MMKRKQRMLVFLITLAMISVLFMVLVFQIAAQRRENTVKLGQEIGSDMGEDRGIASENGKESGTGHELELSLNVTDFYITNTGDSDNLYYIDEDHVLWGCGSNQSGQLGQGTCDYEEHKEWVKIAEHVVHVDYSKNSFVVYLTEKGELYGFGDAGKGALQQFDEMTLEHYAGGMMWWS